MLLFKSLFQISRQPFAKLASSSRDAVQTASLTTVSNYYENLLRFTEVKDSGQMLFKSEHFDKMIKLCKDEEDIDITISAYYNFVGHYTTFSCNQVDQLFLKAIECKAPEKAHDILKFHNYLMYYPSNEVLSGLANYYNQNNQKEVMQEFAKLLRTRKFIKFDPQTVEHVIDNACFNNDQELLSCCLKILQQRKMEISEKTAGQVVLSITSFDKEESQKQDDEKYINYVKTLKTSHLTIPHIALYYLSINDIDSALVKVSEYGNIDESVTKPIVNNDNLIIELFSQFDKILEKEGQQKYYKRFAKVIVELVRKIGNDNFHEDLKQIIDKQEEKMNKIKDDTQ